MICDNFNVCLNDNCPTGNDRCLISKSSSERLLCEEKGKKYMLINDNCSISAKYHVDGQLINGNMKKCDYMIVNHKDDNYRVVFVELKGQNVSSAAEQLLNTVELMEPYLRNLSNVKYYARIVLGKCSMNFRTTSPGKRLIKKLSCMNRDVKNDKYADSKNNLFQERTSNL